MHEIKLEQQMSADLGVYMLDAQRVTQILLNLLSNALKFSSEGKTIDITTTVENDGEHSKVNISVKDQGIGISEEDQAKLFQPFQQVQTDQSKQLNPTGNGLGLYICRQIARCMGGDVFMASKLGVGTTVTLALTLEREQPAPNQLAVPSLPENPASRPSSTIGFLSEDQNAQA